ncbi:MAG TPA: LytTR family transcriptional regulator DNA-binding domain-containing protein [Afipia sp.]
MHLARKIGIASGERLRSLIVMSALFMGLTIWTTHMLGMLALAVPAVINFLILPTLISFMVCFLAAGFAIFTASEGPPTLTRIWLASVFLGVGIVGTYYIIVLALHTNAVMASEPSFIVTNIGLGVLISMMALWLDLASGLRSATWLAALTMAASIVAIHYMAVAGINIVGNTTAVAPGPVLSRELLAIIVSIISFVLSAMFLLTLIPEIGKAERVEELAGDVDDAGQFMPQHAEALADSTQSPAPIAEQSFPIEKDGRRCTIPMNSIVAVKALAHYTSIFDGEATWFCPLSISEIESMLDPSLFARVHRSHIVNLDRVAFFSRSGETVVTLTPLDHSVPVSRSRRGWLKELLQQRASAGLKRISARTVQSSDSTRRSAE